MRGGLIQTEGVSGEPTSLAKTPGRHPSSSIFRCDGESSQLSPGARARPDLEPVYFVSKVLQGPETRY